MDDVVWNKIPKTSSSSDKTSTSKTLKRFSTLRITKSKQEDESSAVGGLVNINYTNKYSSGDNFISFRYLKKVTILK